MGRSVGLSCTCFAVAVSSWCRLINSPDPPVMTPSRDDVVAWRGAARQCEDERFELDMVIEAGSSAINLLEPMADEIKAIDKTSGVRSSIICRCRCHCHCCCC